MNRRSFLEGSLSGAALLGLGQTACKRAPSREEALDALVREVVVSSTQEVVTTSQGLVRATKDLASTPSVEALQGARRAWRPAVLAWKGAQCFRQGPMVETSALLRAAFWPPRPAAIDQVLASERTPDDTLIGELGVDAKGLYALEYLLFPLGLDDPAAASRFSGDSGKRQREFVAALARNVHRYAAAAAQRLGTGQAFGERFSKAGNESLSTLLTELIATVETVSAQRLDYVLKLVDSRMLKPREIEGWPSAVSHELALAQVSSTERLYRGGESGGISALTQAVAPAVDERIRTRYAESLASLRALGAPLERVVHSNRGALARAATATKQLEIALKVDLAGALGVTLTFAATDGD